MSRVIHVSFAHDGQRLASASLDKTVKIWDLISGRCLKAINSVSDPRITRISFDDTDRYILTRAERMATSTEEGPIEIQSATWNGYGLCQGPPWITCNGQKILWLPSDY